MTQINFERIARGILELYKPPQLNAAEFDGVFGLFTTAALELEKVYTPLKRAHLHAARGRRSAARMINAAIAYADATYNNALALSRGLHTVRQSCMKLGQSTEPPKIGDIIEELKAIERDFGNVNFGNNMLVVTTDDIELEYDGDEFNFGAFQIKLDIEAVALKAEEPYELEALDPHFNPSGEYVHPHVSGRHLCAGDGKGIALRAAQSGRYYDFFVIVNQILSTYNPNSPYAKLDSWTHGESYRCHNCGEYVDEDDLRTCEVCREQFCEDCTSYCDAHEQTICRECIENGECECSDRGSSGCVDHENNRCIICDAIPTDEDLVQCSHAHIAHSYSYNGRQTLDLCEECARDHAVDRIPCTVGYRDANLPPGQRIVTGPCVHFGTETCAFVQYNFMEEGTRPAATDAEAEEVEEEAVSDADS